MHKVAIIILASCILATTSCSVNEKQSTSGKAEKSPIDADSASLPHMSLKGSTELKKGEYTIEGRVTDITTDESLPFANIEIKDRKDGAVTDLQGKYHLTIPPGVYCVRARMIGYEILAAESIQVETGKITIINFRLGLEKYSPGGRIKTFRSPP
jgi:hypothetical protein